MRLLSKRELKELKKLNRWGVRYHRFCGEDKIKRRLVFDAIYKKWQAIDKVAMLFDHIDILTREAEIA